MLSASFANGFRDQTLAFWLLAGCAAVLAAGFFVAAVALD
jgi:hypothetical protein